MSDDGTLSLKVLSKKECEILRVIGCRIIPQAKKAPQIDLAQRIDTVLVDVQQQMRKEFKLLLVVFEYGAPLLGLTWKPFTSISEVEQDNYLAGWERSRLPFKRMGFQVLKRSVLAAYYGSEWSWKQIGYRGPWLTKGYPHNYAGTGIQIP